MSHSTIKNKISKQLKPITDQFDEQANEIVKDLLKRLHPFKHIVPSKQFEKDLPGSMCAIGTDGGVAFTPHDLSKELTQSTGISSFFTDKDQFSTFEETRRYCEGTEGLLELLTRYHHVKTDKVTIRSVPDVHVWENGKAVFREEHREDYEDKRVVNVTFESTAGNIMFYLEEKVDKKNKVREQKVY